MPSSLALPTLASDWFDLNIVPGSTTVVPVTKSTAITDSVPTITKPSFVSAAAGIATIDCNPNVTGLNAMPNGIELAFYGTTTETTTFQATVERWSRKMYGAVALWIPQKVLTLAGTLGSGDGIATAMPAAAQKWACTLAATTVSSFDKYQVVSGAATGVAIIWVDLIGAELVTVPMTITGAGTACVSINAMARFW